LNQAIASSILAGTDRNRLGSMDLPPCVETHCALLLNLWMGVTCKYSVHSECTKKIINPKGIPKKFLEECSSQDRFLDQGNEREK
jgi:hypothetical protein